MKSTLDYNITADQILQSTRRVHKEGNSDGPDKQTYSSVTQDLVYDLWSAMLYSNITTTQLILLHITTMTMTMTMTMMMTK